MFAVVLTVAFLGFAADRIYQIIHAMVAAMARVEDQPRRPPPTPM